MFDIGGDSHHEASPAPSNDSNLNYSGIDVSYTCIECGKTASTKADIRKHYHYKHPGMPIRIIYSDTAGSRELPSEDSLPPGKRKISAAVMAGIEPGATPAKRPHVNQYTPEKQTYSMKDFVLTETVLKPFMCGECGKRSGKNSFSTEYLQ